MSNKHPLDQIEPAALTSTVMLPAWNTDDYTAQTLLIQFSQAVSLKRIADALDPTGGGDRASMNVPDILYQTMHNGVPH